MSAAEGTSHEAQTMRRLCQARLASTLRSESLRALMCSNSPQNSSKERFSSRLQLELTSELGPTRCCGPLKASSLFASCLLTTIIASRNRYNTRASNNSAESSSQSIIHNTDTYDLR